MALKIHNVDISWVRPQNGRRIMGTSGKLLEAHYQLPERIKRTSGKLDIAALIRGDEKPCYKMDKQAGAMRGGVDIFFQAALLGCEDQADVDRRALASLIHAVNLQNEGVPVTLYACWISVSSVSPHTALGWCEVTDTGLDMLAGIINENTFRDDYKGVMAQRVKAFGPVPFGSNGGSSETVRDPAEFKRILVDGRVITDSGIVMDWVNGGQVP